MKYHYENIQNVQQLNEEIARLQITFESSIFANVFILLLLIPYFRFVMRVYRPIYKNILKKYNDKCDIHKYNHHNLYGAPLKRPQYSYRLAPKIQKIQNNWYTTQKQQDKLPSSQPNTNSTCDTKKCIDYSKRFRDSD